MNTKYTQADICHAEESCQLAHRKLGIKKSRGVATKADYRNAERAAKRLDKIQKALKA